MESVVGRMIQRTTLEITRGLSVSLWERRARKKLGSVVVGVRESKWIWQIGMLEDSDVRLEQRQRTRTIRWRNKEGILRELRENLGLKK